MANSRSSPARPYLRDGRSPVPIRDVTSRAMRANRPTNTVPEISLRAALRAIGRKPPLAHPPRLPGRPDLAFTRPRLAVFVNGCFWHRCPYCNPSVPKTHQEFWSKKFDANVRRDRRERRALLRAGWPTITLWECQIRDNPKHAASRVVSRLNQLRSMPRR